MKRFFVTVVAILCCTSIFAIEWHNPLDREVSPMQGLRWQGEERESYFDKLPLRAKKSLSKREWVAVNNTSGVSVRFRTSSPNITVRCKMEIADKCAAFFLYGTDNHGVVNKFEGTNVCEGDIVTQSFKDIEFSGAVHPNRGYDYQLWLPSKGRVETLEIGVDDGAFFDFKDCREELPIVLYDCEGDGKPWSRSLSVDMDRPIISLGGNTLKFAAEIEAKVFVVDGTPKNISAVVDGVKDIRRNHPITPILISEKELYEALVSGGLEGIYHYDDKAAFGMPLDHFCLQKLREVLSCPVGEISTTRPVVQSRAGAIEWHDQCGYILKELREGRAKSAVLGNSIVQNWCSNTPYEQRYGGGKVGLLGLESWNTYMDGFINMGIGADRVENLLWRVYNDQFEVTQFEQIIIMIGTNNIKLENSYDEIAEGIDNLIHQIQVRQPTAQIFVVGVLPRKDMPWAEVQRLNAKVEVYATQRGVKYVNVGHIFLDEDGTPRNEFYGDNVHLSAQGYMIYGEALMNELR